MIAFFTRLYRKNTLLFALVWIGIYCVLNSLSNSVSAKIGIDSSAALAVNALMTVFLLVFLRKNGLFAHYGICRSNLPAKSFLWYIPLLLFMTHNLWCGARLNMPVPDTVCFVLSMLCVGFLEEVIFRGFLFRAMAESSVRSAITVSSITFGIGHIMNLFNGSGMSLAENIFQIVGAITCGFMFVILFHRGGSLFPCIIAHAFLNATSTFSNEGAHAPAVGILLPVLMLLIAASYAVYLAKALPKEALAKQAA